MSPTSKKVGYPICSGRTTVVTFKSSKLPHNILNGGNIEFSDKIPRYFKHFHIKISYMERWILYFNLINIFLRNWMLIFLNWMEYGFLVWWKWVKPNFKRKDKKSPKKNLHWNDRLILEFSILKSNLNQNLPNWINLKAVFFSSTVMV